MLRKKTDTHELRLILFYDITTIFHWFTPITRTYTRTQAHTTQMYASMICCSLSRPFASFKKTLDVFISRTFPNIIKIDFFSLHSSLLLLMSELVINGYFARKERIERFSIGLVIRVHCFGKLSRTSEKLRRFLAHDFLYTSLKPPNL